MMLTIGATITATLGVPNVKKHLWEYSTSTTISATGEANVEEPWWSGNEISE